MKIESPGASDSHLYMRPIYHAHASTKTSNHADSRATLRSGLLRMYLAAPLHAQAWASVQTGVSSRLQPHLMGLYTGMQWKCLPVPTDGEGNPAIHYTTVYRVFAK